eukprot:4059372-Amphidinium_carterae.4
MLLRSSHRNQKDIIRFAARTHPFDGIRDDVPCIRHNCSHSRISPARSLPTKGIELLLELISLLTKRSVEFSIIPWARQLNRSFFPSPRVYESEPFKLLPQEYHDAFCISVGGGHCEIPCTDVPLGCHRKHPAVKGRHRGHGVASIE